MRRTVLAPLAALSIVAVAAARQVRAQEPRAHVGRTTRPWVDSTRRAWRGPGLRPLPTTIWYPTDDSVRSVDWLRGPPDAPFFRLGASTLGAPIARAAHRYPLIVVSHGNGGSAGMLGWLAETLASAGYVVVGIDHLARMFTEASLRAVRLPVRIVVGSADHTTPAATNAKFLAARLRDARLRIVSGAGHYTFVGECEPAGAANFPELCHELPQVDRGAMHRFVADDAVRFFDRVLARAAAASGVPIAGVAVRRKDGERSPRIITGSSP